jgi:hypothetical protein
VQHLFLYLSGLIRIEYVLEKYHCRSERHSTSNHRIAEYGANAEKAQARNDTNENGIRGPRQVSTPLIAGIETAWGNHIPLSGDFVMNVPLKYWCPISMTGAVPV